ncbi:uncharacterized protein LOC123315488 isoform X1 [Coccinella septempunctata]|uniref:uncharacterized protein LOC123315488 isoform X1 n=1 Tax=Coccinella septempunctata TaxID=41139 RepID=UPI001D092810|nr:uncharacterized protein LOC123315488 isoform X1 [Coccinella septempunctata]
MKNEHKILAISLCFFASMNEIIHCQDTCNPCTGAVIGYCCNINNLCCDVVEPSQVPRLCPSLTDTMSREICRKSENRCNKRSECPHPNNQDCCPTRHCGSACVDINGASKT